MPWIPGRVPEEVRVQARRRLRSATGSRATGPTSEPVPVPVPDPDPVRVATPDLATRVRARLPTTVRGGRVGLSRAAAGGIAVVAVAAVALAGSYAWRARAVEAVRPVDPTSTGSAPAPSAPASPSTSVGGAPSSPAAVVVVDVAGKVRRPGVVTLPLGSRVVDALAAAGGVRGDVDLRSLNLARLLVDGEQVLVGAPGAPPVATAPATGPGPAASGGVVDLNAATLEQLDSLPGVGPVLAQRILDWRTAHGRFSSIDELREVSGIGESRFADIAPHVRV